MGKIIQFPKMRRQDAEALRLKQLADEVDDLILWHLQERRAEVCDVAGILAHRLGTLMRHLEDKGRLWDFCEKLLKKQAALD